MSRLSRVGSLMFATGMLGLSFFCVIYQDFIIGRPPAWPADLGINPALGYLTALLVAVSAVAILATKKGGYGALVIAFLILALGVFRHLPQFMSDWLNAYKSMALFGGALLVAASLFRENSAKLPRKILAAGTVTGSVLLAVFFIACGYAHFKFADFVQAFIPEYIPFRGFFTYFTAVCLIAGGIGIVIPRTRKWAAVLSGVMVGGWFILLHIPRVLMNPQDMSDRLGLCESLIFAGIFFVLANVTERNQILKQSRHQ